MASLTLENTTECSSPTVSVIIPCYNSSWAFPRLVENLKQIDLSDCEIVFVDDGSSDGSAELFKRLVPNAIIVQQENNGLADARNVGVQASHGEFLQLLDADDTIQPDKLKTQVEFARRDGADVVWSNWRMVMVDQNQFEYQPFQNAELPTEIVEALLAGWWAPPVAYLFRRKAYLDVGGCDESLRVWEDFDLFLRLAVSGKRHLYVPADLANYHRYLEKRTLSRRNPRENLIYRERIIHKLVETLRETNQLTPARRKAAGRALHVIARAAFEYDEEWFRRLMHAAYDLDPDFAVPGTIAYRTAARLLGLAAAERIAMLTRGLRRHFIQPEEKHKSHHER